MRIAPLILPVAIAALLAGPAGAQQSGKKLYRWVDPSGKVHYTDALPPEAVNQARAELSAQSGLVQGTVDRALTDEERKLAEAQAAQAAQLAEEAARQRAVDEARLASYATESDLEAAFAERRANLEETLKTQDTGINAQLSALADVLERAGDEELAGRKVPDNLQASVTDQRKEILKQEALRLQRAGEQVALDGELARLRALYRERQQRMEERGAAPTDASSSPDSATPTSTPAG